VAIAKNREFLLKEKLFSIRDKVEIMSPDQQVLGYFKGKIIKIGNTYRLFETGDTEEENPLLTVQEKPISMRSVYTFFYGGEKEEDRCIGRLKRKVIALKPSFWFEDPDEKVRFTMKGNIWALKYEIVMDGETAANINRKMFRIKGTYGVQIGSNVSDDMTLLILGIVVMLHHEREEKK
jgi:uncharacterized protein YxjI